MLISKDNSGKIIGWRETYFSKDESVDVSVVRNITTISTRDKTTGKVESKTFFVTLSISALATCLGKRFYRNPLSFLTGQLL